MVSLMASTRFDAVRLGVIGMGNFGKLHALTAAGIAETELVALVARRQASLDAVKDEFPDVRGWLDLDKAIAESNAEAWVVASSTASHVPITAKLLEAGYPVLLEKPIADNLEEASSLEPLVKADSGNLMLGHILLFGSEMLQIIAEVRRRGPLTYIGCVRFRPVTTMDLLPGESPFHLTMVHDLYAVLALVQRAEPVHFTAQVHRTDDGQIDLALAQLQWESGLIASFAASFLTPPGMAPDGFDRMEVFGRGWAARANANPRPVEVWDEQARWPMALEIRADQNSPTGMLAEELRCFARIMRGEQTVPVGATYHDAMQIQRWLDKLEACATGTLT